jgi:CDGSH-type Zn-finger protein
MDEPVCAQKAPYRLQLEPGDYSWCACGRSKSQPFCDGSHAGSGLAPVRFTVPEARPASLCGCKRSQKPPFCDGTHKTL